MLSDIPESVRLEAAREEVAVWCEIMAKEALEEATKIRALKPGSIPYPPVDFSQRHLREAFVEWMKAYEACKEQLDND